MSTSICQGLQSCLERGLVEPRVLRLKLSLPNSSFPRWNSSKPEQQQEESDNTDEFREVKKKVKKDKNDDDDMKNGLSFLLALTSKNNTETQNVYVHPMAKRLASMLSAKSLEMCTENLGSETGSDTADNSGEEEVSLLSEQAPAPVRKSPMASREVVLRSPKRLNRTGSFPPPLTSVSGSAGFKVRPHREDGRLVLKVVAVASSTSFFHAERVDGRLTLRLLKNFPPRNEEEEEENGVENEIGSDQEDYEEEEEETEEVNWEENGGDEMEEDQKLQRPSRCKEDGHGNNNVLMNWDNSFLVAT